MFTNVQYKILGMIAGGTFWLSLLGSTVTGALTNQGGTGATGPAGSIGQPGPNGQPGTDGREVEFSVENNVLQWRYVGETTWNSLDLDLGQEGSGSIINTSSNTAFTHWIFAEEALSVPFPTLAAEPKTVNLSLENVGGAIGNAGETNIIDVAGSYQLDVNLNFEDNDLTFIDFDLDIDNHGGYAGLISQDSILIAEAIEVALTVDFTLTLLPDGTFNNLYVDFERFGQFIGSMNAFSFLRDITYTSVITTTTPTDLTGDNFVLNIQEVFGFTGNNFSFYILTESE